MSFCLHSAVYFVKYVDELGTCICLASTLNGIYKRNNNSKYICVGTATKKKKCIVKSDCLKVALSMLCATAKHTFHFKHSKFRFSMSISLAYIPGGP